MAENKCVIFKPTLKEFTNLDEYIEQIEHDYPNISICKIIPPDTWQNEKLNIENLTIDIACPIKQIVSGNAGAYHVTSMELKPMNLQQLRNHSLNYNLDSKTVAERERQFWKSIGKGIDPIYGADIEGSLFNSTVCANKWNLENDMLRLIPQLVPGVNSPMIYVGTWRAMFAYHVEDLDLYSVNYLHMGAEKSWYSIPPSSRIRFESLAEAYWASDRHECKQYLRHKTKLFSPMKLKEYAIEFNTVVQKPGEMVITFPGAYHAGFNHGFNIAEATNFATNRWLRCIARNAKRCLCRPDSVFIDIDDLERRHSIHMVSISEKQQQSPNRQQHSLVNKSTATSSLSSSSGHKQQLSVIHSSSDRNVTYNDTNYDVIDLISSSDEEEQDYISTNTNTTSRAIKFMPIVNLSAVTLSPPVVHGQKYHPSSKCSYNNNINNNMSKQQYSSNHYQKDYTAITSSSLSIEAASSSPQSVGFNDSNRNKRKSIKKLVDSMYMEDNDDSDDNDDDSTWDTAKKAVKTTLTKKKQRCDKQPLQSSSLGSQRSSSSSSQPSLVNKSSSVTSLSDNRIKVHDEVMFRLKHNDDSSSSSSSSASSNSSSSNSSQYIIGTITNIDGDVGRLHIKGQRREKDNWVLLQSCTRL